MNILCVGDLNADLVLPYGEAKRLKTQGKTDGTRTKAVLQGGGTMGNMATVLGRLGSHPYLLTDLCSDAIGRFLIKDLEANGVDLSYSVTGEHTSMVCIAIIDEGERLVFPWVPPGGSLPVFRDDTFAKVPNQDFWILMSGMLLTNEPETMDAVLRFAHRMKENTHSRILFDLNLRIETYGLSRARRRAYEQMLELSDIVLGSGVEEFGVLSGTDDLRQGAQAMAREGRIVIARNGALPTIVLDGEKETVIESEKVKPLSVLGAGDTFDAAFTHALSQGSSPENAARFAVHCACYMISHSGRLSLPPEVLKQQL
jgi:sugar/nucleoside kinase (ribokinase family)